MIPAEFQDLRLTLGASLIEREAEIEAALLGLVAREHVLLVGPPGTAKSALSSSITKAIDRAGAFSVLLTKFTTPEELFGPIMLSALREDRYERNLTGYLPRAHIAFIDEVWKASSAILNTLLTVLQERIYDNGGARVACPLRLAIAASNEWPSAEDGQELGAIFDRFLIRRVVKPVSPSNRARLLYDVLPAVERVIDLDTIDQAADSASKLPVSDAAREILGKILDELAAAGIRPGDRRSRKAVGVARAAAWLDGAAEVLPPHLECLSDVLWSSPEQVEQTNEIVTRLSNPVGSEIVKLLREVQEILGSLTDTPTKLEGSKKLGALKTTVADLVKRNPGNKRATELARYVNVEAVRLNAEMLGMGPEQIAKAVAMAGGAA